MSWTSRRRTWALLMKYEDSPSRWSTLFTEISAYWDHCPAALPRLLSKNNSTLARATGFRSDEPLKITSCIESPRRDRKSTRLNSSHLVISYAVFCLKKKKDRAVRSYCHHREV